MAAIVTFGVLLMFWVIGWAAEFAGGPLGTVLTHLSILEHNDSFAKGVLDTKDLIYYVNFTAWPCSSPCARSRRAGGPADAPPGLDASIPGSPCWPRR